METIKPHEMVLLYNPARNKKICVFVQPGEKIHTQWGYIETDNIIGAKPGDIISTHLGEKLIVFRPLLYEKIEHNRYFKYPTQIVRPRDWGLIISYSNIRPGSIVVEIGTGSGAFTAFLCEIVQPNGFVYSYECIPERATIARKNLEMLNVPKIYEIKIRNVTKDGLDEKNVDAVFVDIPEPWSVVADAYGALRPGGMIICYVPTFNQVYRLLTSLYENNFSDIKIVDHFYREIQPKTHAIRPLLQSYVFSAFIIFGRKTFR